MPYKQTDLMLDIINLLEHRWVGIEQIMRIADRACIEDTLQRISFFREFKHLVRLIPQDVYDDEEQRQNFIIAIQHALDEAIEKEEEELDGMGE